MKWGFFLIAFILLFLIIFSSCSFYFETSKNIEMLKKESCRSYYKEIIEMVDEAFDIFEDIALIAVFFCFYNRKNIYSSKVNFNITKSITNLLNSK